MSKNLSKDWQMVSQQHLGVALAEIRQILQDYIAQMQNKQAVEEEIEAGLSQSSTDDLESASALNYLSAAFNLTPFERQVLLLCAGVELSASLARLCATAQGSSQFTYPTFSLVLAAFPDAHWDALTPIAPLRRWRMIEPGNDSSLTQSKLRIDERVLHYLTGISYLDERLQGLMQASIADEKLPCSHQPLVQGIVKLWSKADGNRLLPVIHLCGEGQGKEAIAITACTHLGMQLHILRAVDIPARVAEREALARLWEREAVLSQSALLVDCEGLDSADQMRAVIPFIETLQTRTFIAGVERFQISKCPVVHLEVNSSTLAEQRQLWQQVLGQQAAELNGQLEGLISQLNLSAATIQAVWTEVNSQAEIEPSEALAQRLWEICRVQARTHLDQLAQRITPMATWEDLVLPERERQMLKEIAAQVKQRSKVYDVWEFAVRGANGLGISTLFVGASGTGKTMAAEVLAHELHLDLYRIDLSQVVSKYIGETEKNLRKVFDAAEAGGAILLFDEADALFGKRSEVKDSHDRYANIEVSYLLQRMEVYRGLAILTTNMKSALDNAFLRRIRFVVQFPFPDIVQRSEIWQRIFPSKLPTEGLDFKKLARLNIPGGNIRNIALNAAFLAADEDKPVQMVHLLRAAKSEYTKLEKTLTEAEVGGWI
jgi:hypothetical protein